MKIKFTIRGHENRGTKEVPYGFIHLKPFGRIMYAGREGMGLHPSFQMDNDELDRWAKAGGGSPNWDAILGYLREQYPGIEWKLGPVAE